ncbi:MAG: copper chaperone PCu(A)C [Rubricoccaceae bacterium]
MRALLLTATLLLGACQSASAPPPEPGVPLRVDRAYMLAAPAGGTSALFFEITGGTGPDTLLGALFDGAERVELHASVERTGEMRGMRPVDGVPVGPQALVALRPGGYHVMLIGLREPLTPGDSFEVALRFARAGGLAVRAGVRPLEALPSGPHGH